jgi:hypothetical protein
LGDGTNALRSCDDLIGYVIGVGITLAPTIRSTPATYLAASIGREMRYALAWPARLVRDASIEDDTPFRDLGLPRVNPAMPASRPGLVLAASG